MHQEIIEWKSEAQTTKQSYLWCNSSAVIFWQTLSTLKHNIYFHVSAIDIRCQDTQDWYE